MFERPSRSFDHIALSYQIDYVISFHILALFSFSTQYGIYEPKCGLDKVTMSWGHDEYLYRVLINHGATIPEEGMFIIARKDKV